MHEDKIDQALESQTGLLCCRYFVVLFETQHFQVRQGGVARDEAARWALGVLADGQYEVLGVWPEPLGCSPIWQDVFVDLKVHGVEKIRFVASNEPAEMHEAVCDAFPSATLLPSIGRSLAQSLARVAPRDRASAAKVMGVLRAAGTARAARAALTELADSPRGAKCSSAVEQCRAAVERLGPLYALIPRLRRLVLSGDEVVQRLQRSCGRAVAKHGDFADPEAATSFLVEVLRREERRLGRNAGSGHPAGSPSSSTRRLSAVAAGL